MTCRVARGQEGVWVATTVRGAVRSEGELGGERETLLPGTQDSHTTIMQALRLAWYISTIAYSLIPTTLDCGKYTSSK